MRPLLIVLALLLLNIPISAQTAQLRLATLEWPPYIGHELPRQGYVAEIVRTAFARSGLDVQFTFLPWKRAVEETRTGRYHAVLPEYFDSGRMADFVFSAPFPGGKLALFSRSDETVVYSGLRDLAPYRIGVVRGYVNTRGFDAADYLDKHEFVDDITNLRMLLRRRVDLIMADLHVIRYFASKKLHAVDRIKAVRPFLQRKWLYVAFPKARADHRKLLKAFNAGLAAMRADGTLERIVGRHGFDPLH